MSRVTIVHPSKEDWKSFDTGDATHPQLEGLSRDIGSAALWLHHRDDLAERPSQSGMYRMAVGEFKFDFPGDQTSYVLAGSASVVLEDGTRYELSSGDMAFWPKGTRCTWTVQETFTEFFTMIG